MTPSLTLTYVHGGDDAKMMQSEAREFCTALAKQADFEVGDAFDGASGTGSDHFVMPGSDTESDLDLTQILPEKPSKEMKISDLVSIHDPVMLKDTMTWILDLEASQFWIGGLAKKVRVDFADRPVHLLQLWTDGTPTNFRFVSVSDEELEDISDEIHCLAVSYSSGRWGLHQCDEKKYFLCETISMRGEGTGMDKADNNERPILRETTSTTTTTTTTTTTSSPDIPTDAIKATTTTITATPVVEETTEQPISVKDTT